MRAAHPFMTLVPQSSEGLAVSGSPPLEPVVERRTTIRPVTMFGELLARDRTRLGLRLARAAWVLGVSVSELRELEAGTRWPDFDTYDRICEVFGWPQAFVGAESRG
jgi:predicted transcriptional regulator